MAEADIALIVIAVLIIFGLGIPAIIRERRRRNEDNLMAKPSSRYICRW